MTDLIDKVEQALAQDRSRTTYPKLHELLDAIPAAMGDLARMFATDKDLNARTRIRAQVVSLFDLLAADTQYPDIPALRPEHGARPVPGVEPAGAVEQQAPGIFFDPAVGQPVVPDDLRGEGEPLPQPGGAAGAVLPIPGAEPAEAGQP